MYEFGLCYWVEYYGYEVDYFYVYGFWVEYCIGWVLYLVVGD